MFKKSKICFCVIFIFFINTLLSAEGIKISYVDINKIIAESNVGKKINKQLESSIKKKDKEFKKIEENLKKKDADIIKQKNILSQDELNKKIQDLQKELNDYRVQKDEFNKSINQKKLKATSEMVVYLNKILGKYASENSISLVIQKKKYCDWKIRNGYY